MIPVIFDTDPGIDDAAALAILLTNQAFDIQMISTVAGNVTVDKTTANVLKLTHFFNRLDVPVYAGASQPLVKKFEDASEIHGKSGMPGYDFGQVSTQIANQTPAFIAMADTLRQAKEPVTILTNGALTNLALLVMAFPEVLKNIKQVITMGGSLAGGNMTSLAEFNFYTDPLAAQIVLKANLPLTIIGLDVTLKALLTPKSMTEIAQHPAGLMLTTMMQYYGDDFGDLGKPMHDTNTVFYALHPEMYQVKDYFAEIITEGPAMGGLIADVRGAYHQSTNVTIAQSVDAELMNAWYVNQIKSINSSRLNLGKVEF